VSGILTLIGFIVYGMMDSSAHTSPLANVLGVGYRALCPAKGTTSSDASVQNYKLQHGSHCWNCRTDGILCPQYFVAGPDHSLILDRQHHDRFDVGKCLAQLFKCARDGRVLTASS
jgi:hypothetical protein